MKPDRSESLFNRAATLQPLMDGFVTQAEFFAPRGQWLRHAAKSDLAIRPHIARLGLLDRPAHIAGFIVAVRVDSVNRMSTRRSRADISQKRLEVVSPAFTDMDAATTIEAVFLRPGILAALEKVGPCSELWRDFAPDRMTMTSMKLQADFKPQASARFGVTAFKVVVGDDSFDSAIAATKPTAPSVIGWRGAVGDCESVEALSNHGSYFTAFWGRQ